jgi:hypothetical protein
VDKKSLRQNDATPYGYKIPQSMWLKLKKKAWKKIKRFKGYGNIEITQVHPSKK